MKIKSFIGILALLMPFSIFSQTISGKIVDTNNEPLELATIAIINPSDSTLFSYATSNKEGIFSIDETPDGTAMLQVHFVGFQTFQKQIEFGKSNIDLGTIKLQAGIELDDVTVVGIIPVKVKEDTISYNTKAFRVRVDDTVEDLLKKLPGIQVDASGSVTAQGEEIKKVYVDGKEFFSGDPKMATKNLSADAIESVEVIDEKSEKSRVTGINDAQRDKVLNLKLKEDSKVNDFGKFQGGYGTDNRYVTSANYNRFSPTVQMSVLGRLNNINSSGSDITETINFRGGGMSMMTRQSGAQSGYITTGMAGANFGYTLKDKKNLTGDYNFNHTNFNSGKEITNREELIGNRKINSYSENYSQNLSNSHRLNFNYMDRSNSLSSTMIYGNFSLSHNQSNSNNMLTKDDGFSNPDLESKGISSSGGDNKAGGIFLRYTKRFSEESKRNFSVNTNINATQGSDFSTNTQNNKFNISDPLNSFSRKTKSDRDQRSEDFRVNIDLEYTEPITDNHLLEFSLNTSYNHNLDDVNQQQYVDDVLSTPLIYNYYFNNLENQGGVSYLYNRENFSVSGGAEFQQSKLFFGEKNVDERTKVYNSINPIAYIMYRPARSKFMRFQISRRLQVASGSQLSPIVNNFNTLFIRSGNPDLEPEDVYTIGGGFGNFDFESGNTFHLFTNYSITKNTIINTEYTDAQNIRYSSYVNKGNRSNLSLMASFGKKINIIRFNTNLSGSYSDYLTLINQTENQTQTKSVGFGLVLENANKETLDISVGGDWNKNFTSFSTGNNSDRTYFSQSYYVKMDWNVSERLNLNSQFTYSLYTDSNFGTNISAPIWNAGVTYSLLKSKRLSLGINAMDILNKSIGVEQSSGDNYFQEVQRDVLANYYMFTLTYNLSNTVKPPTSRSNFRFRRI